MKKLIKFGKMTALIWLVFTLYLGYIYLIGNMPSDWSKFVVGVILAPLVETFLFIKAPLWLATLLKKKLGGNHWFYIAWFISGVIFAWGHMDAYYVAGFHWSFVVQGFFHTIVFWLGKKYNCWVSVVFHAKANFAIMYVFPLM